jgi:hypothetical protein
MHAGMRKYPHMHTQVRVEDIGEDASRQGEFGMVVCNFEGRRIDKVLSGCVWLHMELLIIASCVLHRPSNRTALPLTLMEMASFG